MFFIIAPTVTLTQSDLLQILHTVNVFDTYPTVDKELESVDLKPNQVRSQVNLVREACLRQLTLTSATVV
jgi:hypothetical protein